MQASITWSNDSIFGGTYAVMIVLHFYRPVVTGVVIVGEGVGQRGGPAAICRGMGCVIHLGRLLVDENIRQC